MRVLVVCYENNLKVADEIEAIKSNFDHEILYNSTIDNLIAVIEREEWDIIHFPTHGSPHMLQINKQEEISGYLLNELLRKTKTFVFANACSSANIIGDLENTDIISWRVEVRDEIASEYAVSFYRALRVTKSIERAAIVANNELRVNHYTELPIILIRGHKKKEDKSSKSDVSISVDGNVNTIIGHQHN